MKSMKTLFSPGLVLLLLVSLLSGCTPKAAEKVSVDTSGELKTVRIGGITNPFSESAGIAQALGYFEEELAKVGYKPEYSAFAQAGPALNEALSAKAIDFGIYADFPQLVLKDKGIDVRVIAPVNTAQQYSVVVHGGSGIKTPKDLEGKKIIVGTGTILQKIFEDWVADGGADISKINQLNALADAQSVFASGEADAVLSTSLAVSIYKSNAENSEVIFSTESKPDLSTVVTFVGGGEYLDENPEAAKAVIRALYRAYQYAAADSEKAYEALTNGRTSTPLIKEVYGYDPSFSYFKPEFTSEAIRRIGQTNDFLFRQKLISEKVDLNKFVDTQYYDAVKGEFE